MQWLLLIRISLRKLTAMAQIQVAIQALSARYSAGLLIAHAPARGAYFFQPGQPALLLPYDALAWAQACPSTPVMLFKKQPGDSVGYYHPCRCRPDVSSPLPTQFAFLAHTCWSWCFRFTFSTAGGERLFE